MKSNELMIGDWIICNHYEDKPFYHKFGVGDFAKGDYEFCEPIPITPEILEKNGFKLRPDGWLWCKEEIEDQNYIFIQFRKGCDCIRNCELNFIHSVKATFKQICYVHQLQHALRMCGIEKELII